ncbi:isocitrate lyase/phosphoenolpyruvate mutase family protein, partial [Ligilactobacillus salivarius]|nr:isocitrate lyase/phosphoenolpyruvate mutase family protein [Ligilactobacillus salivarius]
AGGVGGLDAAIERAQAYVEAGAEMLFPEAITELAMYRQFADAVQVPILANITEFGATPLFTTDELRSAHVAMALYPLSAFRAMNRAAEHVYNVLRQEGTQKSVIDTMQTRNPPPPHRANNTPNPPQNHTTPSRFCL